MIRLGKLADYAIVILSQLSKENANAARSAHYLAQKTHVPEPTVAKLLKILTKAELVVSSRGAGGGYQLSRPPASVSVADIITAVDGPVALVSCVSNSDHACKIGDSCHMRGNWDRINEAVMGALAAVTLSDMITGGSNAETIRVEFRGESHVARG